MRFYHRAVETGLSSAGLHDAAYALLHEVLRTDWGLNDITIEKTERGKPYLAGQSLHISVSHTQGFVCCAVSEVPVGVDCEYLRSVPESVMRRTCTERELQDIRNSEEPDARFLLYWTLKESISKKRGVGLRESFRQYEITFEDGQPVCAGHRLYFERIGGFFAAAAE